jgi:predicted 3-demethylubiquinone-9 3-methyltransferase (glyoxalase superfamily)
MMGPGICLWIEGDIEEAARFYTGLFPNSQIGTVQRPAPEAPAIFLHFTLNGRPFSLLANAQPGPRGMGMSIEMITEDQAETDHLWQAHLDAGGSPLACGWLTDRYGIAWQIIPQQVPGLLFGGSPEENARAFAAMEGMTKIDIAALERAKAGEQT